MSKVLLFSDLHLHPHKRSLERMTDCLKTVDWVFETAKKHNIKSILFGGDFFHDRQKIEVYTYQQAFKTLQKWLHSKEFQFYVLLGNHDLWFNDQTSISSVIPLSALPNIEIISNPQRLSIEGTNWDFIPFTHNPVSSLDELRNFPGKPEYCLGHIAVNGAILHGSTLSDVSIENDHEMLVVGPELFKDYRHTFLGHYHQEQRVTETVEYIGSPLELNFGEAFQEKHIIIFDTEDNTCEYIVNDFSPRHLILKPEDKDKYDLNKNFVRFYIDDIATTDLITLRKEILSQNEVGSLEIRQEKKRLDEHIIQDAKAILYKEEEMLAKYVDQVGTNGLERDTLLEIGKIICCKGPE